MNRRRSKGDQPFSLLVKPASADCNLNCAYCFYLDKCHLYAHTKTHRMSETVLEHLIREYMATPQPVYTFGWQGGEPTLMGIDFFRKVIELQQRYGSNETLVANGIQTNATLIDDEFAEHLSRYHYLVGCSLDGPADSHDHYRRTRGGGPTHDAVLKGIRTLAQHGVEFNILVLVSQANVQRAKDVYHYLVDNGFYYHQYIPCVEFTEDGKRQPFAITDHQWGDFMCTIFDLWYPNDRNRVSVRYFDSLLQKMVDGTPNVCALAGNCCNYVVVEHNGDVYPCDFFVQESMKLGNIMQNSLAAIMAAPRYRQFGAQKAAFNKTCLACDYLNLCMGDCLKHRQPIGNNSRRLSVLCAGWKQIIKHTHDKLEEIAATIRFEQNINQKQGQLPTGGVPLETVKIGRNHRCPCGSGKKYKKCCGR